jgi:pimeloyl-ACP methyl ester carboxylesterase
MPSDRHFVFLVPGFFGFANLGDLKYFAHVQDILRGGLAQRGIDAVVVPVKTSPTASVRKRAQRLLQQMVEHAGDGDAPIHLVGHSSGGLDCRLLLSSGAALSTGLPADAMCQRVRSVVSVATPHYGTPVATFFKTVPGAHLLRLLSLSLIYSLRYGRVPLSAVLQTAGLLVRLDALVGPSDPMDQLYDQLLADFSGDRQREIREFFAEVNQDQSLIEQLVPEKMIAFNANHRDVAGVRYGCVVAKGRPPGVGSTVSAGLSAYAQASHAIYAALWNLTSRMDKDVLPLPKVDQVQALVRSFGELSGPEQSDGLVPVLSQLWGEVIFAVQADHHDVIGHFDDPSHDPPHYDWITCGSGFRRPQFERLWSSVAAFVAYGETALGRP